MDDSAIFSFSHNSHIHSSPKLSGVDPEHPVQHTGSCNRHQHGDMTHPSERQHCKLDTPEHYALRPPFDTTRM